LCEVVVAGFGESAAQRFGASFVSGCLEDAVFSFAGVDEEADFVE
jgi:hypothetical protein